MTQIAVQLHTLRNLEEDAAWKLERVADAGYDGVQFTPRLAGATASELVPLLEAQELAVAGSHISRDEFEEDFEGGVAQYETLGTDDLVIPSYDRESFTSRSGVESAAADVHEFGDRLAAENIDIHYHNHSFEFTSLNGATGFEVFAEETAGTLWLEIDTGLAYRADEDPAELLERYADRVELVHLTDTIPGSNETAHIDLGEGEVDLQAAIDATIAADAEWLIYENGRTDDPITSIQDAMEFIEAHR